PDGHQLSGTLVLGRNCGRRRQCHRRGCRQLNRGRSRDAHELSVATHGCPGSRPCRGHCSRALSSSWPGGIMNIRRFILLVGWLLLAAVPFWAEGYTLTTLRDVLLFGLFALSLDYLWGKTGILSFGHAAFFGLGAYGMAIVTLKLCIDPQVASMLGLLVGVALPMVIAGLIGYFLIFGGVRAAYLTIVTLALTIIAQQVAIGWSDMTGGDSGLIGVPPLTLN